MTNRPTLKALKPRPEQKRPRQQPAIGHEIALASVKKHGKTMTFELMDGRLIEGVRVQGFDKFTVTLEREDGRPITIFKHGILSFCEV